jgi:hypothetical protein
MRYVELHRKKVLEERLALDHNEDGIAPTEYEFAEVHSTLLLLCSLAIPVDR